MTLLSLVVVVVHVVVVIVVVMVEDRVPIMMIQHHRALVHLLAVVCNMIMKVVQILTMMLMILGNKRILDQVAVEEVEEGQDEAQGLGNLLHLLRHIHHHHQVDKAIPVETVVIAVVVTVAPIPILHQGLLLITTRLYSNSSSTAQTQNNKKGITLREMKRTNNDIGKTKCMKKLIE